MSKELLIKWVGAALVASLTALGTTYTTISSHDRDHEARISSLEQSRTDTNDHIHHIESQVDKLVEWALGHK